MTTKKSAASKKNLAANPQAQRIQQLANTWNNLSVTDQSSWQLLATQLASPNQIGPSPKIGGYPLFVQNATTLINAGGVPQSSAPALPANVADLPSFLLNSTVNGAALTLNIVTAAPYPNRVIVYAAAPCLAGRNTYKKSAFKVVGSLPHLVSGVNDIAALYQTKYRISHPGYEIAIKIVGVSPGGFRTNEVFASSIVLAPGQVQQLPAPTSGEETVLKVA